MDKKLLIFGLVLFGIIGMSGIGSATNEVNFNVTFTEIFPTAQTENGTYIITNNSNTFFNMTVCANGTDGHIGQLNITLPTGFTFVSNSNGTNASAFSMNLTGSGTALIANNNSATAGQALIPNANCIELWFNASVNATQGPFAIGINATNTTTATGGEWANHTSPGLYVDAEAPQISLYNVGNWSGGTTTNNSWYRDTTPTLPFNVTDDVENSTLNCTLYVGGTKSGDLTTANDSNMISTITVNHTLAAGSHSWYVNCTDPAGWSNISLTNTIYIHSSSLVTSWYTTNGSNRVAYPGNHSVLKNNTVNFHITLNTTTGGFNVTILGWNTSQWKAITFSDSDGSPSDGLGTATTFNLTITASDFYGSTSADDILLSNSTNRTMRIFISNQTTSVVQVLDVGVWNDMYMVSVPAVDNLTVGNQVDNSVNVYYNITNWKGTAVLGYMNYTPTGIINQTYTTSSATGAYDLRAYADNPTSNFEPMSAKYVGNLTLMVVNISGMNVLDEGYFRINKTILATPGTISPASTIITTSSPTNIYKHFNTNVTVNVTLLNETIPDYATSSMDINVTVTAGVTNASINYSNSAGAFCNITFSYWNLSNFSNTGVASGDVSLDVNVLVDVNMDGIWDYNTTVTGEKTIADASDIVVLSVSPTSQNITAAQPNTVTFTVRNKSNMNLPFNITISSSDTKFYNGSSTDTSAALTSFTEANDTGGAVTLVITPEQNGTIDVAISSGALTSATEALRVHGSVIDRGAILPVPGSKMTYNETYTIEIPVMMRSGLQDNTATINISYAGDNVISSNSSETVVRFDGNYAVYQFKVTPTVTGYLNLTVFGGDNNNATIMNIYEVAYVRNYTVTATHGADTITTLVRGLNNTINITVKEGTDINGGNMTITYYNATQSGGTYLGSRVVIPGVNNMTTVGLSVPKTAATVLIEVSNASEDKSGNITLNVATPSISVSNIKLINSTSNAVLVSKESPSNLVVVNNTIANITLAITNVDCVQGLTISFYKENQSGTLLNTNTTADTVELNVVNITNLLNVEGLNATKLFVLINNSAAAGWSLLNVTLAEPTVTPSKTSIPVDVNTSVDITVTAYDTAIAGLSVVVKNSSNTTMDSNTTDSSGIVNLLLGPMVADTLRIWINGIRHTQTITATKLLSVTYTPTTPNILAPLVLSVRPYGSTTEIVTNSYIELRAPESGTYVLKSATDGTYTISVPTLGTYAAYAVKSGWTDSAVVYITVTETGTTTTTTLTSTTTTTTSTSTTSTTTTVPAGQGMTVSVSPDTVVVGTATDLTVTVTNTTSSEAVEGATVSASGAGVSGVSGTTDANGTATLSVTATEAGTITITATMTGFVDATASVSATAPTTTTTIGETCATPGDYPPCGTVTLAEVVDYINLWSDGEATLATVIDLINAWAAG